MASHWTPASKVFWLLLVHFTTTASSWVAICHAWEASDGFSNRKKRKKKKECKYRKNKAEKKERMLGMTEWHHDPGPNGVKHSTNNNLLGTWFINQLEREVRIVKQWDEDWPLNFALSPYNLTGKHITSHFKHVITPEEQLKKSIRNIIIF